MIDTLISAFSNNHLVRFLSSQNSSFINYEENMSVLVSDYPKFDNLIKLGEIEYPSTDKLMVFTCEYQGELTSRSSRKGQYEIAKKALKEDFKDGAVFVFYDQAGRFRFSFLRRNYGDKTNKYTPWKRYTYYVNPLKANKTFRSQIGKCKFESLDDIKKSFSIDVVTDEFYNNFKPQFDSLANLIEGNVSFEIKQDLALLFAIRVIFIGFVQKRKWIGDDEEFLLNFWKEYKQHSYGENQFYIRWLEPLFFEALNTSPGHVVAYQNNEFSDKTRKALNMAPYLNGELFKRKDKIDNIGLYIPDSAIDSFIEFLFQYNFTIEENTRYDEDLELNPEFLGIIFERLVNKEDGAIYTPRTEVDFMCRITVVKWLHKVSKIEIKDLYHLFFKEIALDGGDFEDYQKNGDFSKAEIKLLIELLKYVSICDPASGSGAFPVGMMLVLNEILELLQSNDKAPDEYKNENAFERKKTIIINSLYGVEVKRWAVWINQLRLWLSLFVDIPAEQENEFRFSPKPLLPNLDFKIRCGDSLVQRIGNKLFPIHSHNQTISSTLKARITKLKKDKINFFYNHSITANDIRRDENAIFRFIIDEQIVDKKKELNKLKRTPDATQASMFETSIPPKQSEIDFYAERIVSLENDIAKLQEEKEGFKDEHPLIWNIEFAEIFYDKGGFDIVVGNPPYVRQEDIADPYKNVEPKDYKLLLQQAVRDEYPNYFKKKEPIDGKSDLYTYFYLKSLHLLNPLGVHCFICSNSWLDVGYGVWMQKFLLYYCRVHFIIDNHAMRSFASADVNTIISVIDAPVSSRNELKETFEYKFVAFKKPFEEVIFSDNLIDIENQHGEIINNAYLRSYPASVASLLEEGTEYEENSNMDAGIYAGDKWGGKYLRAPEVFFKILESGKEKFMLLKEVAIVRRGITTGSNDFFYLTKEQVNKWKIESEFLKPVLKSPQECKNYLVTNEDLKFQIFLCNKTKDELIGTNALKYIEYGEKIEIEVGQGSNQGKIVGVNNISSVTSRRLWYSLGNLKGNTFWVKETNNRLAVFTSKENIIADCRLYFSYFEKCFQNYFNSTIYHLYSESMTRAGLGLGARSLMVFEVNKHKVIKIEKLNDITLFNREVYDIFKECGIDPTSSIPIEEQEPKPLPDRKELDDIVFDALSLEEEERKEVYRAVCRLVWNRVSKAKSV